MGGTVMESGGRTQARHRPIPEKPQPCLQRRRCPSGRTDGHRGSVSFRTRSRSSRGLQRALEWYTKFTIVYQMKPPSLPSSLAETAAAKLRAEIVSGELPSGSRLAEAAVAQRLGVSRVPVREALVLLEREGLVEFTPTGRARVRDLSPHDFEELFALRLALEPVAARLAAPALKADPSLLEKNLAATRRARSLHEVTALDLDFHQIILAASGNSRLLRLWSSLRSELEWWLGGLQRSKQVQSHSTKSETLASHGEIVRTFRTGTPADCERLMRSHILDWREWLPPMPDPS